MISPASIQQILSRIDIIDIVGGFVKLKKRGSNYLGLCPFHNEKSPSFIVSPAKEIYKCFGCGKSGNSISFLMEHEKYSYVEALRWLAAKYNVEIEETEVSAEVKQQQQTAESLHIINSFAQKYFTEQLFETEEGQSVGLSYLKSRGFREETIRKFQVGFNPETKDSFTTAAIQNQFNPELLQKAGLTSNREGKFYDNYRGRIIFPVHNQTGKIIGFGARLIKKNDKAPKYINTHENEVYVKSRILYGMWYARTAIDKADECLLVEGYTDVLSLHQSGIENVVASGGTSLTTDQLRLIKKYTNNLTIIYDGDSAGVKAAVRGLDLALEEGLNVNLVLIPDNDDPDSYINKIGPAAFADYVRENKKDVILFTLDLSLKEAGTDTQKKNILANQIAETISKINKAEDFVKQQEYIKKSAQLLQIDEEGLTVLVNKYIREKIAQQGKRSDQQDFNAASLPQDEPVDIETTALFNTDEQNEQNLVKCLLEYGLHLWQDKQTVADFILSSNEEDDLVENDTLKKILSIYKQWYDEGLEPTSKNFIYSDDPLISSKVVSLVQFPYEISDGWKKFGMVVPTLEERFREEVQSTINYLSLRKIKRMIAANQKDIEKASPEEQMNLLVLHNELKKLEMAITKPAGSVILK
jgi:DNA primase